MSASYCETVDAVIDSISLRGSHGCELAHFLENINIKLLVHIVKHVLNPRKFRFQINGLDCDILEVSEDSIRGVVCFAPPNEILSVLGVKGPEVLPPTCLAILELVAAAGSTGYVVPDIAQALDMQPKSVHDYVDKLVLAGHIVKRNICPVVGSARNRVSVLHLKRFAKYYDPSVAGMQYMDNSVFGQVADLIFDVLETHDIASISTRVMAHHIGITKKQMYSVRCHVLNTKKIDYKIKFFSPDDYNWFISRSDEVLLAKNTQRFTSLRNLPLYESVNLALREAEAGMDTQMISQAVGVTFKTASRVSADFSNTFDYPLLKTQSGKQVKYMLFHKNKSQEAPQQAILSQPSVEVDLTLGPDCEVVPPAGDIVNNTPVKSSLPSTPAPSVNKRNGGLSEQQKAYEQLALQYLEKMDGIASEVEVIRHIRNTSQSTGKIDKKTFNRLLDRLNTERKLVVMNLTVPLLRRYKNTDPDGTETISVVILGSACGDDQEEDQHMELMMALKDKLIARRHAEFFQSDADHQDALADGEMPSAKKRTPRKRKISSVEDSEAVVLETEREVGHQISGEPVRKVREYNMAVFQFPKEIKDIQQVVSFYGPPELLICAMNLHLCLMTELPFEDDLIVRVPALDALMGLLPLKYICLTCKHNLGDQFLQDLQANVEYAETLQAMMNSGVTLGEIVALEESLELDHFVSQVQSFRYWVSLQLMLLLSVGILRCDDAVCFNDLLDCLKGFHAVEGVHAIIDEVEQRQFSNGIAERIGETFELRLTLLCALVISTYHPTALQESEVVVSLLERLSQYSFVMNERHTLISGQRNVYRYWRSLIVHCVPVSGCDETTLAEYEVMFKPELEDKLGSGDRPCVHPTQKAVDDIKGIWTSGQYLLSIPLTYLRPATVATKRVKKRSRGKFAPLTMIDLVDEDNALLVGDEDGDNENIQNAQNAENVPVDEEWTKEQDLSLIASFLFKFVFKRNVLFFPTVLHNFTLQGQPICCDMNAREKFSVDPENSTLAMYSSHLDFSHMIENLYYRGMVAIPPHTLNSCKKRLPQIVQANPGVKAMCAQLLCRDKEISPLVSQSDVALVVKSILQPSRPSLSLVTSRSSVNDDVVAIVIQMLFENRLDRQQRCIDRLFTYPPELVAQVCRELYMWGLLRKAREGEEEANNLSGFARTEMFENSFSVRLAPFFLRAGFTPIDEISEGSLGGYSRECDRLKPLSKKGVMLSHECLALLYNLINRSTSVSISVGADPDVAVANNKDSVTFSDDKSEVIVTDPSVPKRVMMYEAKGFCFMQLHRVNMTVTASSSENHSPNVPPVPNTVVTDGDVVVPWKASEGESLPFLYQLFASKALSLLADKPGSNAAQIGAALHLLGGGQVQQLLDEMLVQKAIYWKISSITIKKKGPFQRTSAVGGEKLYFVNG